jgi:hypothetical protein
VGVYFRTDTTRLTFGELWRISSRFPVFLAACVQKVLGLRAPVTWAILHDDAVTVLPAEEVPARAMRALAPAVDAFQRLGARLAFYQTVPASENLEGYGAVLLPAEQNAVAVVAWSRARIAGPGKEGPTVCALASRLHDDTFLSTSNRGSRFNKPPGFKVVHWPGAAPEELSRRHREALAESGSWALPVRHAEGAKEMLREMKRRNFEWNVSRGVYVPLTDAEQARLGLPAGEDA